MKTDMRQPPENGAPTRSDEAAEVESAPWSDVVGICTKCASKRDDLDQKGRPELRNKFKAAFKELGVKKRVRVVEASCFGLCPKHGQTVMVGSELVAGTLRVVRDDEDASRLAALIASRIAAPH